MKKFMSNTFSLRENGRAVGSWEGLLNVEGDALLRGCMIANHAIVINKTIAAIRPPAGTASAGGAFIAKSNTALVIEAWRC